MSSGNLNHNIASSSVKMIKNIGQNLYSILRVIVLGTLVYLEQHERLRRQNSWQTRWGSFWSCILKEQR